MPPSISRPSLIVYSPLSRFYHPTLSGDGVSGGRGVYGVRCERTDPMDDCTYLCRQFQCRRVTPLHSIAALSLACAGINTCKRAKKSSPPRLAQGVINTVGARSFYQTLCREFIFVSKPLTNH